MANYRSAILITYPVEQAIKEAISLADAAGYSVIETVTQRQITRSRFGIGRGKAEEVKEIVKEIKPDIIALGYDQYTNVSALEDHFASQGLETKIVRLEKRDADGLCSSTLIRKRIIDYYRENGTPR